MSFDEDKVLIAADIVEEAGYADLANSLRDMKNHVVGWIVRQKGSAKAMSAGTYSPGTKLYGSKPIALAAIKNSGRQTKVKSKLEVVPVYAID